MPTTVQLLKGNVRLVADRTVKELLGLLVKTNCNTPSANICALLRTVGTTPAGCACVTEMFWSRTVILATRLEVVAVKEKVTTPLVMPVMDSQD